MIFQAYVVHRVRGRLRLRIREKRQDPDFFEALRLCLETLPGITSVEVNNVTGSVLMHHPELPYADLAAQLTKVDLFDAIDGPEPEKSALSSVIKEFSWMNRALSEGSSGNIDLRSLAVIGLVGLAVHQAYRGNIAAPAIPLLLHALSFVQEISSSVSDENP